VWGREREKGAERSGERNALDGRSRSRQQSSVGFTKAGDNICTRTSLTGQVRPWGGWNLNGRNQHQIGNLSPLHRNHNVESSALSPTGDTRYSITSSASYAANERHLRGVVLSRNVPRTRKYLFVDMSFSPPATSGRGRRHFRILRTRLHIVRILCSLVVCRSSQPQMRKRVVGSGPFSCAIGGLEWY